jgi:cephalosporin-C deacetylase-like acetyl esterase
MKGFHATGFSLYFILFSLSGILRAQETEPFVMKPIDSESFEVMHQFFDYDKSIPLEARIVDKNEESKYVKEKIVFRGINNSLVPGYLAIPKNGNGPFPCVLLMHGISDSKESWWQDTSFNSGGLLTKQLIDSGFAVVTLDAEYHGERLINNDYESADVFVFQKGWLMRARDMIVQSVVEHRRAIDYLSSRTEIDSTKFGIIGYSMGGMMAFDLAAVDSRVKVAVTGVTPVLKEPSSALAVFNFAPFISSQSFLMLMGDSDTRNYGKNEAQQLFNLIKSNNKELTFFESGHKLPEEWTKQASEWMNNYLK